MCAVKYKCGIPDIPLEPKLLNYPHKTDRFVEYNAGNLELNYKYQLHSETMFALPLGLLVVLFFVCLFFFLEFFSRFCVCLN